MRLSNIKYYSTPMYANIYANYICLCYASSNRTLHHFHLACSSRYNLFSCYNITHYSYLNSYNSQNALHTMPSRNRASHIFTVMVHVSKRNGKASNQHSLMTEKIPSSFPSTIKIMMKPIDIAIYMDVPIYRNRILLLSEIISFTIGRWAKHSFPFEKYCS